MFNNFAEYHIAFIILLVLMVIFFKNPIYSLLCFIFAVINILSVFILFQVEFVAIILFLVYVGAIAVLFLAIIMFLNLSYLFYNEAKAPFILNIALEKILIIAFFAIFFTHSYNFIFLGSSLDQLQTSLIASSFGETFTLAYYLYTDLYLYIFFGGVLLFLTTKVTLLYTTLPKIISYNYIKFLN